jgi:hypothetical protein
MKTVLIVHTAATLFMVGLIWFVQVVHYPLFNRVGPDEFQAYAQMHSKWTTYVVGPPMLLEALTAVLLLWLRPPGVPWWMLWTGVLLLAVVWLSTWFLQVPQHAVLVQGFNAEAYRRLVAGNWLRVVAWSARGGLALWITLRALVAAN